MGTTEKGILSPNRNRGLIAWFLSLILVLFYLLLYWDRDIDNFIFETMLSDLNQQIQDLEKKSAQRKELMAQKSILLKEAHRWSQRDHSSELKKEYHTYLEDLRDAPSAAKIMNALSVTLNPISQLIRGKKADKWFLYSFLYTMLVVLMGIRFIKKWKNDKYQKMRTLSVMFFQFIIAFMIPGLLEALGQKAFYFNYFWPLKMEYLYPSTLETLPRSMAIWAIMMSFVAVPVLTYFYGKRWYCSWVCGCGALANTFGDPWRHLSSKSRLSWRIEMVTVYSVLMLALAVTGVIIYNHYRGIHDEFSEMAFNLQKWYGSFIAAGFAGVIGTGFYPIAGTRLWCRFGCPQAAILGILQKFFSRFRISTNGDQCMSCGNCSTYCEMGIDVRSYAMQGKDIVRASCVGCGLCMSVCPRGVLKLEMKRKSS